MKDRGVLFVVRDKNEVLADADTTSRLARAAGAYADAWMCAADSLSMVDGTLVSCDAQCVADCYQDAINIPDSFVVVYRVDPPIDATYIDHLRLLLQSFRGRILNPPHLLLGVPERWIGKCAELFPPTIITSRMVTAVAFAERHLSVVVKTLGDCAGRNVSRASRANPQNFAIESGRLILLQKDVWHAEAREVRAWYINGSAVAVLGKSALARSVSFDAALGHRLRPIDVGPDAPVDKVGAYLRKAGVWFAAVDFVDSYVVDINITSPGLLVEAEVALGVDLADRVARAIFEPAAGYCVDS